MEDGAVVWTPEALAIKEFKAIWGKNRSKEKAFQEMSYVYFMEDLRSPYMQEHKSEREEKVIRSIFGGKEWTADKRVRAARDVYRDLQRTRSMALLEGAWDNLDDLAKFLKSIEYNERDVNGKYINDVAKVKGVIAALPQLVASMKKLEEEVRKELADEGSLRGGRQKGFFEDAD